MADEEIAYQNKDITSKVLAENFKGKSFRVYGLNIPEIKRVLPTNIPAIKANELRLDNIFELADGTAAIVDYESDYDEDDKVKYLNYLTGVANRYKKEKSACPSLRMIIIYTGDISREQVSGDYDIGAIKMHLDTAFLLELDSDKIFRRIEKKIKSNELLSDEDIMQIIILPLSYHKKEDKEDKIRETVKLATKIKDKDQQIFALSGILTFTDKIIDMETANKIKKVIEMTKVAMIFEEEKQEALLKVEKIFQEEKRQALYQAYTEHEKDKQMALSQAYTEHEKDKKMALSQAYTEMVTKMIKNGYPTEEIVSLVKGYSYDDVEILRKKL